MRWLLSLLAAFAVAGPALGQDAGRAGQDAYGRTWMLQNREGRVVLAFAVPESDDIGVVLTCRPGTGRVTLSAPLDKSTPLKLRSGAAERVYASTFQESEEMGGERTASTRIDDPVLVAFLRTGSLTVADDTPFTAREADEKRAVAGFFRSCGKPAQRKH